MSAKSEHLLAQLNNKGIIQKIMPFIFNHGQK